MGGLDMSNTELLAPAGNLEKLKIAIIYGADAVYCGGHNFGLRFGADNFTIQELKEGTEFVHRHGAKIYITVNMIPHNDDLTELPDYLHKLESLKVDALIISDPGVLSVIKNEGISIDLHLSTQANAVNYASINFWAKAGIERVILARELNRSEIKEIKSKTELELEMFIHGAMCISYSGRCLLSNYMVNRDANRGKCAHSCRWKYYLMEEQRPGEYYPVFEDDKGTYIMNSKDLCLIKYIPELVNLNLDSFKIEGRMKSLHYVATVTGVYRKAFDKYNSDPDNFQFEEDWLKELQKISHRDYTTGFFLAKPGIEGHNYESSAYQRNYDFMGIVREYDLEKKEAIVEVRNKYYSGDNVEIMGPDIEPFTSKIGYIINEDGKRVEEAPHPKQLIKIPVKQEVKPYYLIRRKRRDDN